MENNLEIILLDKRADLHNHTRGSDGRQSSLRFLLGAMKQGKNIIAMADHNSVQGYRNLEQDIYSVIRVLEKDLSYDPDTILNMLEKIKILKSTELITSYDGVIVEVLGYGYDLDTMEAEISRLKGTVTKKPYQALHEGFSKIIEEKGLVFNKDVIDRALDEILTTGRGGVTGPFFNELVSHEENLELLEYEDENGNTQRADTVKAFINKHLYNKRSPFFVDMSSTRPSYIDTIDSIHKAGGKAFIAHPGRYADKLDIESSIDRMIDGGLDGVEVFYPDHSYEFRQFLLQKVREHGILASGGSDDHHYEREGIQYEIGRVAIPDIPETRWIEESAESGKDFISSSEYMKESLKRLKELKQIRDEKMAQKRQLDEQLEKSNYSKDDDKEL